MDFRKALNLLIREHKEDRDWTNESLEAVNLLEELLEKSDKYRWHDLRKNPEDLPRSNGIYLVWRPNFYSENMGKVAICYFDGTDTWHDSYGVDFTRVLNREDVSAWKYIEPFEGAQKLTEMQKFINLLDDAGIKWVDFSDEGELPIERTRFEYKGKYWSVIHGFGTYGGWDSWEEDRGLLEIYDFDAEPIGFLTAEEAFKIITEGA